MLKDIVLKAYGFVKREKQALRCKLFCAVWLSIFAGGVCALLFWGIPAVGICVALILSVSVKSYFTKAYKGNVSELHTVIFLSTDSVKHRLPAMLWSKIKTWIWILIPFVGIVFATIKFYEYRFVPYILTENEKISPEEALHQSSEKTKGFKKALFYIDMLFIASFIVPCGLFFALSRVPALGFIFGLAMFIYMLFYIAFVFVARELVNAIFYVELRENSIKPYAKAVYCPFCMSKMDSNCMFCSNCGEKLK